MQIAGIIIEYDPMHTGHAYLQQQVRARLGADTALVGVMSGNFVQRGDFALLRKHARARAAVESGLDLVLELPLPWTTAGAEQFADGGIQTLLSTGLVTDLAFGSEIGDAQPLQAIAACLDSPAYEASLRPLLDSGASFAACRQRAVESLLGPDTAALLAHPNNILGVEYCKALLRRDSAIRPMTVRRTGAAHDGALTGGEHPSASAIRDLLRTGARTRALGLMTPAMAAAYRAEEAAGRAPVWMERCERAMLARLRSMSQAEFARLDQGREGLWNRLNDASRAACSLDDLLDRAKTKRYAHARLRRMALWAYLGLEPGKFPETVPYLRPLAANAVGCQLLARMRKTASVPVLTKPADVRLLGPEAQRLFQWEVRATDLYTLAYPDLSAAQGGTEWKEGPCIL